MFDDIPDDDEGWRLDHWRDGVTTARIAWRDSEGATHELELADEGTALAALDWVGGHPRTRRRVAYSATPRTHRHVKGATVF